MRTALYVLLTTSVMFSVTAPDAAAWGERGHHSICAVATRLVREPVLKKFLLSRQHILGHVCNIPDIGWRNLNDELSDSAHYINFEKAGLGVDAVPLSFAEFVGPGASASRAIDLGSLWWRADQFYRLAVESIAEHKSKEQSQDGIYGFMVNLGLLGHFVADASQPLHNSVDYDGWAKGHGGLHSFYESTCVDEQPLGYEQAIYRKALSLKELKGPVVAVLKQLSHETITELKTVESADHLVQQSKLDGHEKVKAVRLPPEKACQAFEPLIVRELARGAAVLATLWDRAYIEAGRPDLSSYHSYRYPLSPEHVPIDYFKP